MIYLLIAIWLSPLFLTWIVGRYRYAKLRKQRNHDLLVHVFSDVRDAMALKVASGEVDERSAVFRFFYERNSSRITDHERYGLCFSKVVRNALRMPRGAISQETKILLREIRKGDDDVKMMAIRFAQAYQIMLAEAWFIVRLYNTIHAMKLTHLSFLKWVAHESLIPAQVRSFAQFTRALVHAAGQTMADANGPTLVPA